VCAIATAIKRFYFVTILLEKYYDDVIENRRKRRPLPVACKSFAETISVRWMAAWGALAWCLPDGLEILLRTANNINQQIKFD